MLYIHCKVCYTLFVKQTLQYDEHRRNKAEDAPPRFYGAHIGATKERSCDMDNKIQELRKARRITQEELADAVGVTRQTIISLEGGRYNASLALAHKIAKYFSVTIEEIFLFVEE